VVKLPLIAILSAVALGASIVRGIAQLQLIAQAGGTFTARTLVLLETGNWLGWTAWAVMLAVVMRALEGRPAAGWKSFGIGVILVLAPLVVVPVLSSPWHWMVTNSPSVTASAAHIIGHNLATNALLGLTMLAVAQGRTNQERTQRLERSAADLRARLAESQLAVLRARLDPHFLFNALNSVMVLARRGDSGKVERIIEHLSALLRYSLEEASAQVVPLRVELDVLRHYLEIQQVRHGDRLAVRWRVTQGLEERLVPSFVLQPLVENAMHHGLTGDTRTLTVDVAISESDRGLLLSITDDGEGLTTSPNGGAAEGIGIGHTRARLAGLYGDQATLTINQNAEGRGTRVTISIPSAPVK
jgi:two-component system LytT family sensor kinase